MCKKPNVWKRQWMPVDWQKNTQQRTSYLQRVHDSQMYVGAPQLRPPGGSQWFKVAMFVMHSQFLHTEYIITYVRKYTCDKFYTSSFM